MITYEYRCTECGHTFEKLQSIRDDSAVQCEKCNGSCERLIGKGMDIFVKSKSPSPPPSAHGAASCQNSTCPISDSCDQFSPH